MWNDNDDENLDQVAFDKTGCEVLYLNGTCSMGELTKLESNLRYDGRHASVADIETAIRHSGYRALLANTTKKVVSNRLVKAGFTLLGKYKGNDAPSVYSHILFRKGDISTMAEHDDHDNY